ncbi:MAG: RNA polymerase sporulation sigma factor SigG [Clostridia bacterium]|nr:RNA polymerase sporulation sigma factor SigG [Clostridia bacterium]
MLTNKVEICGIDTGSLPVLRPAEMRSLLEKAKKGDLAARDRFIFGNLRLVLSVVQRFAGRGEQPDDLFQVGCIGLMKAIAGFDLSLDVRFSTYAVPMIAGEIRRHLRDYNAVRVSRSIRDLAYRAMQAKNRLSERSDHDPTVAEIAKELQLPEADVVFALDAISDPVSLYEPVYHSDEDATTIMDHIKDTKDGESQWLNSIALEEGMSHLNEREQKILKLRYFGARTQMEVSKEIGISQAQVSRLEKSALRQLEKYVTL